MNNEQRTIRGFTLIELLVAIAILAVALSIAGVIFRVSIESHRAAAANAEVMQKLRAITDQLNSDFKGVREGKARFEFGQFSQFDVAKSYIDGNIVDVRADCIAFFAIGDFQSSRQYRDKTGSSKTVVGNVAGVFYGQEENPNPSIRYDPKRKILVRRQTILTSDPNLRNEDSNSLGEFYKCSLSEWEANPNLDVNNLLVRPVLDPQNPQDFEKLSVMYMAKGVDNFTIQFAEWDNLAGKYRWAPEIPQEFSKYEGDITTRALKFTFTLYDSKGIIKQGRTFTHIVYLD